MGYPVTKSTTAQPLLFWLIDKTDHITGLTGKSGSVTVSLSKNGAAGGAPAGAISEVDSTNQPGLYKVAGNATDNGTLGPLALYAKDTASDPFSDVFPVVAYDMTDAVRMGLTCLPNVVSGSAGAIPTTGNGANQIAVDGSGNVYLSRGRKNVAFTFEFPMLLSGTTTPATGKTVALAISKDGAAFATATNSPATEVATTSNGYYSITLTASEMNANSIGVYATASGCDPTRGTIVTQG